MSEPVEEARAGGRRSGREVALQVLYAIDLGETGPRDAALARGDGSEATFPGLSPEPSAGGDVRKDREAGAGADPVAIGAAAFERVRVHFSVPRAALDFARELVAGVTARQPTLDEIVAAHSRNWRVSRMAVVDRNVLRIAVYELRETDTPVAIVIDEAVDLARRFGSDTSPAFVNGILDAVARELRAA